MIGTNDVVAGNCLTANGEYAFDAYSTWDTSLTGGPSNIALTGNEISYNDTCNWESESLDPVPAADRPSNCGSGPFAGCGCSGGGKFWEVDGATVTDNYVHDNYNVGLWADTDNVGFDIADNTISDNWGEGIIYEISYNFSITDNVFSDDVWGGGPTNPGFPEGAIYVSESGGDSRVPGPESGEALIEGNTFTDNWSGVVLWESANRFCGSPDNSSTGACTLVDPSVANISTCDETDLTGATPSDTPDYYDLCRWKTQNVTVTDNTFNFNQADIPGCDGTANSCGENGMFSQYGTSPSWSPYMGDVIETAITKDQNNLFSDNTYSGPWSFMYANQSGIMTFAQWQAEGQDVSSSDNGDPPTTTTTTLPPTTSAPPTSTDPSTQQCAPAGGLTLSLPGQEETMPLGFNQFNPSLGTLTGVQVSITGNITFTVTGTTSAQLYEASNELAVVWGPGFTTQSDGSFTPNPPTLLPTGDQSNPPPPIPSGDVGIAAATPIHNDPAGPVDDVDTFTDLTGSGDPSSLTGYSGTGSVQLDIEADGSFAETGSNVLTPQPPQVSVQVCLTYNYAPPSPCSITGTSCSNPQNLQVSVNPGDLVLSTPYTSSNPFVLPAMTLSSDGTYLATSATFPAPTNPGSQQIDVTSTLSPAYAWTLSVAATNLTDGTGGTIPSSGLGLTNGDLLDPGPGPGDYPGSVSFSNLTAENPNPIENPPGAVGLSTTPQSWATSTVADGTAIMDGTLTLLASTATPAGTYTGTISFSVS